MFFRPEALLCDATTIGNETLVYEAVLGTNGEFYYSRYDRGAGAHGNFALQLGGTMQG